jgi:hypothetical protein
MWGLDVVCVKVYDVELSIEENELGTEQTISIDKLTRPYGIRHAV